jgi:gamma-glutamyltranspeptidase/glutathione hydrolase
MADPKKSQTDASGRPATGRPVVYATNGIISSGHYLTSMAGMRMLLSGGNAFDAVVAAGFAAAVTEPIASYSLAAEGVFMLYDAASGDFLSLSGQGTAPGRATIDFFNNQGLDEVPTGPGPNAHLSFTVPGVVDAYLSLLERYGTKTLGEILAPSIQLAQHGFPHYEYMIDALDSKATRDQFAQFPPGGSEIFYDKGSLPAPGSMLVQPGLANTFIRMVAAENAAQGNRLDGIRAARDDFYKGGIARTIVDLAQSVGGILEMDDLAGYHAEYEEPVKTTFMGYEIAGQSAWCQAPVLQQTLNILESFDLKAMGHNSPQYVHTVVEAIKLAVADREAHYGDPNFSNIPVDGLLSKEYALARATLIDPRKAHPSLPIAGDPWKYSSEKGSVPPSGGAIPLGGSIDPDYTEKPDGTTHIAVIDREGNMVCATPSGGSFGKSVFFPEIGCALSTRSEMFYLTEGHPNALEPGKRPRTTLINYIALKDGAPVMTFGCPGGDHQAQANTQLVLNALVFGMNPQEAIEAPRFGSDSFRNSFYPHANLPGQLSLEAGFSDSTRDALQRLGHKPVSASVCGMGATITHRNPETGVLATGADPRRASYAIGW